MVIASMCLPPTYVTLALCETACVTNHSDRNHCAFIRSYERHRVLIRLYYRKVTDIIQ